MPKQDGPYVIMSTRSPATFEIANPNEPDKILGKYHVSALKPYQERKQFQTSDRVTPVAPLKKRGRPKRVIPIEHLSPRKDAPASNIASRQTRVRPSCSPPSAPSRQRSGPDFLPRRLRSQRGRM